MTKLFGTDGIRARAGTFPLDAGTVFRIGRAIAVMGSRNVLVGRDTRLSGIWIESLLSDGIRSQGGTVAVAGVLTTPAVAFLVRDGGYDAGVMISASHNPAEDNGIKVFSATGIKLSDHQEERIEAYLQEPCQSETPSMPDAVPGAATLTDSDHGLTERYVRFLLGAAPSGVLESTRVVLDCANGSAFRIAPEVFRRSGACVIEMNTHPDGANINLDCGALNPEGMARKVVEVGADFGVAFDGDSDRAILADEKGEIVDGDDLLFILGKDLMEKGKLRGGGIVGTVMTNFGLERALLDLGVRLIRAPVGDRFVLGEMLRNDLWLGGEQSGHIIVRECSTAGDGILTAMRIARILTGSGRTLSQLRRGWSRFPQVIINVPVREKKELSRCPEIRKEIERAARILGDNGRVVVRYSGTEALARVMVEGNDQRSIRRLAEKIADRFQQHLGRPK